MHELEQRRSALIAARVIITWDMWKDSSEAERLQVKLVSDGQDGTSVFALDAASKMF